MTRTKVILLVSFGLIFAAGVSVGMLLGPSAKAGSSRQPLGEVLKLSPEQSEQMKKIWSEMMESGSRQQGERRSQYAQQRDESVQALLTAEQRARYDAIQQDYAKRMEELSQERKKKFEQAVAMTKKILTPEQVVKYDEWMKQRERGGSGGGPFWGGRHRHTAPATKAATQATKPTTEPAAARGGQ